jgi:prepilin-type N-terminal cleavage/methylation domain-containing protein
MRRAFTLIELLIVIAVIAILAVVVVLTLNPGQLILQARDSTRVQDLASLQDAIGLYITDAAVNGTVSLGSANTVYVSIPDPTATTTLGDQCQGLGLLSLPTGYAYHCAASSTFRMNDSTGWIPINFKSMSQGGVLGQLPQDPVNSSSSRTYETYTTDGTHYEVTAALESQKYRLGGTSDVVGTDGGTLATVYEKGTKLGLEPLDYGDSALVGYWPMTDGGGTSVADYSGANNGGSFSGSPTWQTSGCKLSVCLDFPTGANNISIPSTSSLNITKNLTITMWIKGNTLIPGGTSFHPISKWTGTTDANYVLYYCGTACGPSNAFMWYANAGGNWLNISNNSPSVSTGGWIYVAVVYTSSSGGEMYWNGIAQGSPYGSGLLATTSANLYLGNDNGAASTDFNMNAVRIYNRALSAAEIQAMYNGGK